MVASMLFMYENLHHVLRMQTFVTDTIASLYAIIMPNFNKKINKTT